MGATPALVFPYPTATTYTPGAGGGLKLTGFAFSVDPTNAILKAAPTAADAVLINDAAGGNVLKESILGTLPVSTPQQTAIDLAQRTYANLLTGVTTRTLAFTDEGALLISGAAACVLTVPSDATLNFPIKTWLDLVCGSAANDLSIAAAGGVTINSLNGWLKLGAQWGGASLVKTAANTWLLVGNLKA